MANIAAVFHWPPHVMDRMPLGELMQWHGRAIDRFKAMHSARN